MIFHSFATDGYFDFAVSMLTSMKTNHGDNTPFLLHTKDMSKQQMDQLKSIYANLTIKNSATDWEWLQEASQFTKKQLLKGKFKVEKMGMKYDAPSFSHWKHYISIYERYKRSLLEAFDFAGEGKKILHLDIDLLINRPLDPLLNLIALADVSILLRPGLMPEWRKTYGCVLGFTVNESSRRFLKVYHAHINAIEFKKIPKGYGQTALWRAYCDLKKSDIKIAQIPQGWVDKGFKKNALILSANIGRPKQETAKRYNELAKRREAGLPDSAKPSTPARGKKQRESTRPVRLPKPVRRKKSVLRSSRPSPQAKKRGQR